MPRTEIGTWRAVAFDEEEDDDMEVTEEEEEEVEEAGEFEGLDDDEFEGGQSVPPLNRIEISEVRVAENHLTVTALRGTSPLSLRCGCGQCGRPILGSC